MAAGLPHPVLLSTIFGLDTIEIAGKTVEFKHVFYTWLVMGLLFTFSFILKGKLKIIPGTTQNLVETVIDGLESFTMSNMGEKHGQKVFPLLCAIFIFIMCQNLLGLIPTCDAPTANINTTAAMALFVFVYYNYIGIKRWGAGYIKHFMGPMPALIPLMLPIEIVSHLSRPLSLALRLFGNIRGEEMVLLLFFILLPVLGTLPIYSLFLLAKVLQAFIFYMLAMIYLQGAMDHAH